MNHTRLFSLILQIPVICILIGYGKVNAQQISSLACDYLMNNNIKSIGSFSGTLSGTAGYCEGVTMPITLSISGGVAPYEVTLSRSGSTSNKDTTVSGITASLYIIQVKIPGSYVLKGLTDASTPSPENGTVSSDTVVITVTPVPMVEISGLAPLYDKNYDLMVPVFGDPAGGTFSGPGLFNVNGSWYFLPRYTPVGIQNIIYAYQESPGFCYGYDTMVVRILEAIAEIDFPNSRNKYCQNDDSFTITGVNLGNSIGSFTISGGVGLTDNHDNTATISPSSLGVNEYTITYTYFDGTNLTVTSGFEIGNTPDIAVSQNANILTANTTEATYQWIDCNNNGTSINGETNRTYIAGKDGEYAVIISENGCIDTSACYLINTTGLEINHIDRNITLYPNPNKGSVSINMGKVYPNIDVTITEIDGRIIQKKNYKYSQILELILFEQPGEYLFIINTENKRNVFRMIKK